MRRTIFVVFISLILPSCSSKDNVPSNVIPPDKMQSVIFDLLKADEFINNFVIKDTTLKRDHEALKLYQQVFLLHKIKREDFYKSYNYYMAHPDKSKALFDSLIDRKTKVTPPIAPLKKELKKQ
jgi:hypothetical protein